MPLPLDPSIHSAVLCRYPFHASGLTIAPGTHVYFIIIDVDVTGSQDGTPLVTGGQTMEILAVV